MALKLPKLDRDTLLSRRYNFMKQAWELDHKQSVGVGHRGLLREAHRKMKKAVFDSPTEAAPIKLFDDLQKLTTFEVCHLNHRTNTGEFDGLEWLATASRLEHNFMDGKEPAPHKLTAEEYKYWWLYQLKGKKNDRWHLPRKLLETKISVERLKEIREIK